MMELDHQQEPEDPEMVEAVEIQGSLERGLARSLVVVRGLVSKLIRTAAGKGTGPKSGGGKGTCK